MGWGHGVLPDGREVGYMVEAVCEAPGCDTAIDRGLSYLCGSMHGQDDGEGCGHYFCETHLFHAGADNPMCRPCCDAYEAEHPEDEDDVAVWPAENGGECPTCLDRYEATEPVVTIDGHRHHARCAP